jgi:RND family efflux transporter MFP subunit
MNDKLKALSRSRTAAAPPPGADRARHRLKALLIRGFPWLVIAGALVILFLLFGERLLPSKLVELETVVTLQEAGLEAGLTGTLSATAGADPYSGEVLFQASGWFEADPYPFRATALVSGVVEAVHVLEGQHIRQGEPIATLIREDADLRLRRAAAALAGARAALDAAVSESDLANARVESMRQEIEVAKARWRELADLATRAGELGPDVLSRQEIIQADLRLDTQEQTIAALEAQLRERVIDTERLAGQLQVRRGALEEMEVLHNEAELEFARTVIRAPVDGIIQRLSVVPGQKKVLMADNPDSATVALLFQPEKLQARIDVPIAEASRLSVGQAVLVASEFLPGSELRGHVQRIVGEADLQRNTLQVKVRIVEPPAGLRPEILCRAQFFATKISGLSGEEGTAAGAVAQDAGAARLRVMVPRSALLDEADGEASVWVVDQSSRRIELRSVKLTEEERGGYVVIQSGLRPGDRVVVRPSADLRNGTRIKI